jgi:hypothetical protein
MATLSQAPTHFRQPNRAKLALGIREIAQEGLFLVEGCFKIFGQIQRDGKG